MHEVFFENSEEGEIAASSIANLWIEGKISPEAFISACQMWIICVRVELAHLCFIGWATKPRRKVYTFQFELLRTHLTFPVGCFVCALQMGDLLPTMNGIDKDAVVPAYF